MDVLFATLFTKHYLLITHKNNCGHLIKKWKGPEKLFPTLIGVYGVLYI